MDDIIQHETELVITAQFAGPMADGRTLLQGLETFVFVAPIEDPTSDCGDEVLCWAVETRVYDREALAIGVEIELLRPLLEMLVAEQAHFDVVGVRCVGIRIGYFREVPMVTLLSIGSADVALLARAGVPISLRLAYISEENQNGDIDRIDYLGKQDIDIALDFYGFDFDPEKISWALEMEPLVMTRKGEIDTLRSKPVTANRWNTGVQSSEYSLEELIEKYLCDFVKSSLEKVADLSLLPFTELIVGIFRLFPEDDVAVSEVVLDPRVMAIVAEYGIALRVAMYYCSTLTLDYDASPEDD